jgi:hypothetical protein
MDGHEATRSIKGDPSHRYRSLFMASGCGNQPDRALSLFLITRNEPPRIGVPSPLGSIVCPAWFSNEPGLSRCLAAMTAPTSVIACPEFPALIEQPAQAIVGVTSNPRILDAARAIAEAQVDLDRIRKTRHELFGRMMGDVESAYGYARELTQILSRSD